MGWAHVRADFTLVSPALDLGCIFLSFHNAFQQGTEAHFQVFPVFLLSDAPKPHCCKTQTTDLPPCVRGAGGYSLYMTRGPGLLLQKQHIAERGI